jgi:transposase
VLSVSGWRATLGVDAKTVVEAVDYDEEADAIVASVRPRQATKRRCGRCGVRAAGYDRGEGRRRWRAVDVGPTRCYVEAVPVRVSCPTHGVVAAQVPWAAHGARHTTAFEVLVAWLVVRMNKSAVKDLLRVSWDTVGVIVDRVVARDRAWVDPFDGLVRIGIDEISYKKGHRYLMVVVDHCSGRLVWAKAGHDRATLRCFFEAVGPERCRKIRLVSCEELLPRCPIRGAKARAQPVDRCVQGGRERRPRGLQTPPRVGDRIAAKTGAPVSQDALRRFTAAVPSTAGSGQREALKIAGHD